MLARNQGSRILSQRRGDEDAALDGWRNAARSNLQPGHQESVWRSSVSVTLLYGAECWPATKERRGDEDAALDGWRNAARSNLQPGHQESVWRSRISDKLRKSRPRWYGHVLRAEEGTVRKVGLYLDFPCKRAKGRQKQRWLDTLHADLKLAGIHPDQARDGAKWRQRTTKADPATKRDKR
ncbi:hypothetical protein ANCDUO_06495 [Ancylostoma duodenale]|uniref:Uncharacterized protein n=1 Tax=Ancylostoma duodenale TaxID=51022 RepID=A0A0C2DKU2_9BILA|nr:hypothetical protein ANCDUO_06495 [Ancylostoma duodenale]